MRGRRRRTKPASPASLNAAGQFCRLDGRQVAEQMMAAASEAVCELVYRLMSTQKLRAPVILAVGGAAGGLGRFVAIAMGLPCTVPPDAEIISSIGDALSMVRAERRTHRQHADSRRRAAVVGRGGERGARRRRRARQCRGSNRGVARTGNGSGDRNRHDRPAQWCDFLVNRSSLPSRSPRVNHPMRRSHRQASSGSSRARVDRHRRSIRRSGRDRQGRALRDRRAHGNRRAPHTLSAAPSRCGRRSGRSTRGESPSSPAPT